MKIVAGGGAVALPPDWNCVAVDVGSESSCARTNRCNRRDSVKNLAYRRAKLSMNTALQWLSSEQTSSPYCSLVSSGLLATRGDLTPARVMLTNWWSPSGINRRMRSVEPSFTCSTMPGHESQCKSFEHRGSDEPSIGLPFHSVMNA